METTTNKFTGYQAFIVAIIAILQFTIVLDFMVLSPLGAILMPELKIGPSEFGLVVSAYAFSAGASGLLAAGFADKFDRKKLLLFFYTGFIIGTLFCALAPTYQLLMAARVVTGLFGGVIGSISLAIITDIFAMQLRGRVMGFVQMAFGVSQVLGIPIGLWLANNYGWHSPFMLIVIFSILVGVVLLIFMKPINEHLKIKSDKNAFLHLWHTVSNTDYLKGFLGTVLLATGGFMLMPFSSAFSTFNLKIPMDQLPLLYGVTGVFTMVAGPLMGKLSDKIGKYKVFLIGTIISMVMVIIYTQLGVTPLWMLIVVNVILFIGITSRIISASALMTAVPAPQDRGAYMSINSSIQQLSGGVASGIAGLIVVQTPSGVLDHFDTLGYVVFVSMIAAAAFMYVVNKMVMGRK
ncbi:MAG: MFS transporter [Bacteroidetes bacterium]|nr:MFS transporter [Bacteroidota bacterium]